MNEFKEEFSQLLHRYALTEVTNNNKTPKSDNLLSNQQILDVIHEALHINLNINIKNVEPSELKTPVNEIVVTTPDAPDVLRMDYNQNDILHNRYKPFDAKTEEKCTDGFDFTAIESLPLSNDKCSLELDVHDLDDLKQKLKDIPKIDTAKKMTMYSMVEDAHKDVMKVVHKLEDLRELLLPEARPIRRLSTIMNLPKSQQQNTSTCSSNLRTTQRAMALTRRSMHQLHEDMPVTPTTSRPSFVIPPNTSSLVKKPTTTATASIVTPKPPLSKLTSGLNRSVSSSSITTSFNKSISGVVSSGSLIPKSPSKSVLTKNSKYAHVKSTIPKPSSLSVKRKV